MRAVFVIIATLALASCADPVEEATKKYRALEKINADADELCAAAKRVEDVAFAEGTERQYRIARLRRETDCLRAGALM